MLAYITPEEAASLREQGGGVAPDGGQYTGPGGVASFFGHGGHGPVGGDPPSPSVPGHVSLSGRRSFDHSVHPNTMAAKASGIASNPPSTPDSGSPGVDKSSMMTPHTVTDKLNMPLSIAENNAKKSIAALADNNVNDLYARRARLNDKTMAYANLTAQISDAMSAAVADGYSPAAISKMNQVAHMNVPDIFGNVTFALQLGDQQFDAADIASMSDADFSALSGNPATTHVNDPDEGFGPVSMAATSLFSMLNPALALPALAIDALSGLSDGRSTGLTSLLGIPNILGDVMGEVESATGLGEVVSNAFSPIQAAVESAAQDVYGFVAPPTHAIAQSLGLHSEPSQFSVNPGNMGTGIEQPQVGPGQPAPAVIDPTGLLGTEMPEDFRGHTIGQLMEMEDVGYIDPKLVTSIFAHGGFVDKPLYSRS